MDEKNSFGNFVPNEKEEAATVSMNLQYLLKICILKNYGHCKYEIFHLLKEMKRKKKNENQMQRGMSQQGKEEEYKIM